MARHDGGMVKLLVFDRLSHPVACPDWMAAFTASIGDSDMAKKDERDRHDAEARRIPAPF